MDLGGSTCVVTGVADAGEGAAGCSSLMRLFGDSILYRRKGMPFLTFLPVAVSKFGEFIQKPGRFPGSNNLG